MSPFLHGFCVASTLGRSEDFPWARFAYTVTFSRREYTVCTANQILKVDPPPPCYMWEDLRRATGVTIPVPSLTTVITQQTQFLSISIRFCCARVIRVKLSVYELKLALVFSHRRLQSHMKRPFCWYMNRANRF